MLQLINPYDKYDEKYLLRRLYNRSRIENENLYLYISCIFLNDLLAPKYFNMVPLAPDFN